MGGIGGKGGVAGIDEIIGNADGKVTGKAGKSGKGRHKKDNNNR